MHSTRHISFALGSAALLGLVLGACFNGEQAKGLPCTANSHCGPHLECVNGYCGGVFACADGAYISAEDVCDTDPDCEDESDEDPANCTPDEEGIADQCSGDSEPFEFEFGPSSAGAPDPMGVIAGQFVNDSRQDLVIAQNGGNFVRIWDMIPGAPPESYDLEGDIDMQTFITGVQELEVVNFEGDADDDIVVLTEDSRLFVYYSDPQLGPPVLAEGAPFVVEGAMSVIDIALGKIDNDGWFDMVAVTETGFVATATGDGTAAENGMTPFQIDLSVTPLPGSDWITVELYDVDGDAIDEMLVSGFDGMPRLWIFRAKPNPLLTDYWQVPTELQLPFPADEFVLGDIDGMTGFDLALLDHMSGQVTVLRQTSPATFTGTGLALNLGPGISGLTLVDFDCAGYDDLVVNVEDPPSVRVLFPNEMSELDLENSIEIESMGRPKGRLALMKFDPDNSWDIFHAVEAAGDLATDDIRGLLTQVPDMP